jgi:type I restriction enzyme S subunit
MSELSYLEKLLDGVEVEWKAVGDVARIQQPKLMLINLMPLIRWR